jgi:4-aminobutyrate aminotransferase-like enzyme
VATALGARLAQGLGDLQGVQSVRGRGLLLAVELVSPLDARVVARRALERGVVVNAVTPTALRLAPPFILTDDEVDHALAILGAVIVECLEEGRAP